MAANPILEISDGVTSVDLLDQTGILLYDWTPNLPEPKGGGTWSDSPLTEGRKLAYRQMNHVVDTMELKVRGHSQDDVIYKLRMLRQLLEKSVNYWLSDSQTQPVWLRARAAYEENDRYCLIYDYRTPRDANPFRQPFFSCRNSLVDNFLLAIEHSPWQDHKPGQGECVEIGAEQIYSGVVSGITEQPAASTDDAYVTDTGNIYTDQTFLVVGDQAGVNCDIGIRFTGVGIPAGATILRAWLELVGWESGAVSGCNVVIDGEDVDDSATFSTYADFVGRSLTTAQVAWSPPYFGWPGWTYQTPDLTAIIQEIVDRVGWASGQDIALFLHDSGSAYNAFRSYCAYGHPQYSAPILRVQYTEWASFTFGRAATCNPGEVFIANKQNLAPVSHIYYYDDSLAAFSGNLIGAATPFAFLPATPAADDIVYFGSPDPFHSLIFDISTAQVDLTTIVWEYWAPAVWTTLTVQDNTATTDPFDRTGVHSVNFVPPAGWNTTAINGVTAFWIRARVTVVGASPAPPQQDNRDIYTCVWPYVELQADQVGGDIPALAEIKIANQSDAPTGNPVLHANRVIAGGRSLSRGENFTAYLNVSDEQNPTGVTVALGANTAYASTSTTPTGRRAAYSSPVSTNETTEVTITLDSTLSPEYLGRFRVFLRYKFQTGSADAVAMRLVTTPGGSGLAQVSDYYYPQVNTDWQVADFGIVNIQPRTTQDEYGTITFEVKITPSGAVGSIVIYLYDLVLIPVDEWATDAVDESGLAARTGAIGNGDLLDIDSVTYPRKVDQAVLRQASTGRVIGYFANRQPGPALLQANAAQRLWFLSLMYESGTELSSPISISHTVQVNRVNRYFSQRGRS